MEENTAAKQQTAGEDVVAPWCNPLTLQPEHSRGVGSKPVRAPPLERHDKRSRTRIALSYFCATSPSPSDMVRG